PVAFVHVLIKRAAHEAIRQTGIEEQDSRRVYDQEARHRHVGIGYLLARELVILRAVVHERTAIDYIKPWRADPGKRREPWRTRLAQGRLIRSTRRRRRLAGDDENNEQPTSETRAEISRPRARVA